MQGAGGAIAQGAPTKTIGKSRRTLRNIRIAQGKL